MKAAPESPRTLTTRSTSPNRRRGFYNNGIFRIGTGAVLNYGIAAGYNSSNITTNVSPITGYGRIKTDIIAPGGNPSSPATSAPSIAPPAFDNNYFQTTAGGQYEYSSTNGGGVPFYQQDSFNGGATTAQYGTAGDNTVPYIPGPPYPGRNPGPNLGGGDFVQTGSLAGPALPHSCLRRIRLALSVLRE